MDRSIDRNADLSWTLIEGERRLDLPAETTVAQLDAEAAAFFTPIPPEPPEA